MTIFELAGIIGTTNLVTFGNAPVILSVLQKTLVQDRGVLSQEQLLYAYTIARVTPGQTNLYIAGIGYMLFGLPGALLCILAIALPSYMMIPFMKGFERYSHNPQVKGFTTGLMAASVGLVFSATIKLSTGSLTTTISWIVFALSAGLMILLKLSPLKSLLVASAIGIILTYLLGV